MNEILTTREAAEYLKIHPETLRDYTRRGFIKSVGRRFDSPQQHQEINKLRKFKKCKFLKRSGNVTTSKNI